MGRTVKPAGKSIGREGARRGTIHGSKIERRMLSFGWEGDGGKSGGLGPLLGFGKPSGSRGPGRGRR